MYNRSSNIVFDPVMVSTSGRRLLSKDGERLLKERLFPLSTLITPNIPEAECLVGWPVRNHKDMENAARTVGESYRTSVLAKGCSLEESIDQAKKYLTRALDDGLQLGHGNGRLNHIISII